MLTFALLIAALTACLYAWRCRDRDGWALAAMLLLVLGCNTVVKVVPSATMALWATKRALMVLQALALPTGCAVLLLRLRPSWAGLAAGVAWLASVGALAVQQGAFALLYWDRGATLATLGITAAWVLRRRRPSTAQPCCAVLGATDVLGVLIEAAAVSGYHEPTTWTRRGVVFSATLLGITGLLWTHGRRFG